MGDWQELGQHAFIGLIFSFLVAKVISMVISFRDENLRIVREEYLEPDQNVQGSSKVETITEPESIVAESDGFNGGKVRVLKEEIDSGASVTEPKKLSVKSFLDEDDDDWEGVESTELDQTFSAATAFVAAAAADRLSQKVPNDAQLQLYGLYKIATEGPCTILQPSALKISARAKWNAWQRLGTMPPEEAMQKYIMLASELFPTWAIGATSRSKNDDSDARSSAAKGMVGPVFSTVVHEEDSDTELEFEAIHASAREGEIDNLLKYIEHGVSVNVKDSDGRTPLHWAVDRGHVDVVELLISKEADVNAKDNEGQTPLHYAAMCEREAIAKLLVENSADRRVKDNDDDTPGDLCKSAWSWMRGDNL